MKYLCAFRQLRFKCTESVSQSWIIRKVHNLGLHLGTVQCHLKLHGITAQMVFAAGDQKAWWQGFHNVRVLRVDIWCKRRAAVFRSVKVFWHKKSDLIEFVRIKHTADQTKCLQR